MSVYKETKFSAKVSLASAGINIVLNYVLIVIMDDAMGAAVATAVTFFVYYALNMYKGIKLSGVKINLGLQAFNFLILIGECVAVLIWESMFLSAVLFAILLVANRSSIKMAVEKAVAMIQKAVLNRDGEN